MITILSTLLLFVSIYSIALSIKFKKFMKESNKNYDIYVENEKKHNELISEYDKLNVAYEKQKSLVENRNEIIRKMYDGMVGNLEKISEMTNASSNNFKPKYNIDDILTEINEKGIENIDEEKLEYLKNIKNNH